ncbi:MAG: helix-turn-helix domain-containing protein [bacterium]
MPTHTRAAVTAPPPSPQLVALLVHWSQHRWTLPVLGYMQRKGGARHAELLRSLGIGRESARLTLDWLVDQGWILRNTGYGHALRPEYVLSSRAIPHGKAICDLLEVLEGQGIEEVALRKWALAVLLVLGKSGDRFGNLKSQLPGITPRALTQVLKALQESGVITREIGEGYPPTVHYAPSSVGRLVQSRLGLGDLS